MFPLTLYEEICVVGWQDDECHELETSEAFFFPGIVIMVGQDY